MIALLNLRIYAYVAAAAILIGFAAGWHFEAQRFAEFRGAVQAIGEAQEDRTTARIQTDKQLKQETDRAHQKKLSRLRADHDLDLARMRADADRSFLPAVPDTPGRSDIVRPATVCFDRDKFDAGLRGSLQRFAERASAIVERGEIGAASFDACAAWALKEWQAK